MNLLHTMQLCRKKRDIALQSLKDVVLKFRLLRNPLANLPLFQDVSITDPGLVCYVPLLKLPVSGYVMKGVTLILVERNDLIDDDIDSFMKIDLNDFEDKEEAAYCEAVIEIVKKHRSRIVRLT
nr:F-box domain, leucine-rich repeat domain, L domain-like protein [Tanacetum cinerariifolium]